MPSTRNESTRGVNVRIFIAIDIPNSIKAEIAKLQKELRSSHTSISWTRPQNLHLTLKFLGEISENSLAQVERAVEEAASVFQIFSLNLDGVGVFPQFRKPRVLWIGLGGEINTLITLAERIEDSLLQCGFAPEKHPFQPHLTIGRFRYPHHSQSIIARAHEYGFPALPFEVAEIVIMRSRLHSSGAEHTPIYKIKLCPVLVQNVPNTE